LLEGKNSTYPQFQCPNCRAYTDLSADVDVSVEDMDEAMGEAGDDTNGDDVNSDQAAPTNGTENATNNQNDAIQTVQEENSLMDGESRQGNGPVAQGASLSSSGLLARRQAANQEINPMNGIDIPDRFDPDETTHTLEPETTRTETPDTAVVIAGVGPLTPRNDAGPFVLDGSAGRADGRSNNV
jgi:E3 ubiquitin-protein ligase DMA1/2